MGSKYNKHSSRSPFVLLSVLAMLLWMSLMLTRTSGPGQRMSQRLHLNTAASTAAAAEAAAGGWPLQHAPGPTKQHKFAPGAPFQAAEYSSLHELLWAHKAWQDQALADAAAKHPDIVSKQQPWPPVLRVDLQLTVGVGNRWPSLVTGLLMAAVTGRAYMLAPEQRFSDYMSLTVDADWGKHSALYGDLSRLPTCEAFYNTFLRPDLDFCKDGEPRNATIMWYSSSDYDVPLLQINPTLEQHMKQLLPSGDFFHEVAKFLFRPSASVYAALEPYKALSDQCTVGIHLRSKKPVPQSGPKDYLKLDQFAKVAAGLAGNSPGSVFIASDSDNFQQVAEMLPGRRVWWSKESQDSINNFGAAGTNPGSDLSAMVDIMLLSRCKHIMLTAGSSFGTMAAGLANTKAVHVLRGDHEPPFYNPWFWVSITSEPCMWKAGRILTSWMSQEVREALRQKFPAFLYHEQCN